MQPEGTLVQLRFVLALNFNFFGASELQRRHAATRCVAVRANPYSVVECLLLALEDCIEEAHINLP